VGCGGAGKPDADADADECVAEPDLPVGEFLLPEEQHREEAEHAEGVAHQQYESGAERLDELRGVRGDDDHADGRGDDRQAGLQRRVSEDVLALG
jgi:hypothetical protein